MQNLIFRPFWVDSYLMSERDNWNMNVETSVALSSCVLSVLEVSVMSNINRIMLNRLSGLWQLYLFTRVKINVQQTNWLFTGPHRGNFLNIRGSRLILLKSMKSMKLWVVDSVPHRYKTLDFCVPLWSCDWIDVFVLHYPFYVLSFFVEKSVFSVPMLTKRLIFESSHVYDCICRNG